MSKDVYIRLTPSEAKRLRSILDDYIATTEDKTLLRSCNRIRDRLQFELLAIGKAR